MSPEVTGRQLRDLADALETEVCVGRLLAHLLPRAPRESHPGRYRVLEEAIEADAALRRALTGEDAEAIGRAWSAFLRGQSDIRLHHTLAVLYLEHADAGAETLVVATVLWCLLLATEEFWEQFGDQPTESPLRERAARELLALNAERGARALAEGDTATAGLHLRCLDACRSGLTPTRALGDSLAADLHLSLLRPDDKRMAEVSRIAAKAIDDWSSDVIRAATERVTDPRLIELLPDSVRAAYGDGINRLKPFTGLGVPVARALRVGLEWHNDWCFDLYTRAEEDEISKVLVSAERFAGRLVPLCARGTGYKPENRALSRYFLFRGFTAEDDEREARDYEEALAWNPDNDNARELLVSACLRRGNALADNRAFAQAREQGEKARRLAPDSAEVAAFFESLTDRESEHENAARLRLMERFYNDEDFSRALRELDMVPEHSRLANTAEGWKSLIYLRFAEAAAERLDFEQADIDFAKAHAISPDPEEREHIASRWSSTLISRAASLLSGLSGAMRGAELRDTLREGRRLLEMAMTLDSASRPGAARMLRTIERLEGHR